MQNNITLIIADIHHRWKQAEEIIASVNADKVIFLGDYFDDFNDTPQMVQETCEWFEGSVNKPNRIHLFGNHDVHYAFPYRSFQCSGYTQWKYFIIHDTLPDGIWDKLKWYYVLDNTWLLTHAGLHKFNLPDSVAKLNVDRPVFFKTLGEYLDNSIIDGFKATANNVPHWIFKAGRSRGGPQKVGGIIWCDYNDEFTCIKGLNQIFGHTPQSNGFPRWYLSNEKFGVECPAYAAYTPYIERLNNTEASTNICLDVWKNTHYAIWNGKTLVVKDYNSLKSNI